MFGRVRTRGRPSGCLQSETQSALDEAHDETDQDHRERDHRTGGEEQGGEKTGRFRRHC